MSHHGKDPFEEMRDADAFRGALGEFPEGQLTKSDEGAIQFQIGVKDGKVVLDFGTPTAWVGMNPQQAADLASVLVKRAREAARTNGQVVSFTIG